MDVERHHREVVQPGNIRMSWVERPRQCRDIKDADLKPSAVMFMTSLHHKLPSKGTMSSLPEILPGQLENGGGMAIWYVDKYRCPELKDDPLFAQETVPGLSCSKNDRALSPHHAQAVL